MTDFNLNKYYKIFINNLVVNVSIGVHDFEKHNKQKIYLDLDIYIDKISTKDNIQNTLDYDIVRQTILDIINNNTHFNLQEYLCEEIINRLFIISSQVKIVKIRSKKNYIYNDCEYVGVELIRNNF